MKFRPAILVGLLVLPGPFCRAGFPTPFFTIECDKMGSARVDNGKLSLGDNSINKVPDRSPAPDKWYVGGSQIKSSVGGGYLAYDVSGKNPKVFVLPTPGKGTEWEIVIHRGREEHATVRAANGPFKGWSLDGKAGQFILSAKPSGDVWVERFYSHK